ncbi:hypothetical protein C3F00_037170, partial [Pseudomonas sp. MWU13-2860]
PNGRVVNGYGPTGTVITPTLWMFRPGDDLAKLDDAAYLPIGTLVGARTAHVLDERLHPLPVGVIGELHPKWAQQYDLPSAPVLFELDLAVVEARQPIKAQPVSKFQAVRRDLALVVDEAVETAQLLACFAKHSGAIVSEVALFDVYRGKGVAEGKKSLAFRVLLQDNSRTLTDEDVEPALSALLDGAAAELGAQLR